MLISSCTAAAVAHRCSSSQAPLEATLRAEHAICDELTAQRDALSQALKEHAPHADGEHERLRCRLGEVCRLLRQAKQAEAELKQVRCTSCMLPFLALIFA